MVGAADLVALSEWADPVATILVGAAIIVYLRLVIHPDIQDLEATQDDRGDRWDDAELNMQERDLLIDDNAERVDRLQDAHERMKQRVRGLEQAYAAQHGNPPNGFTRNGGSQPDGDVEDRQSDDGPFVDGDDATREALVREATTRLKGRCAGLRAGRRQLPEPPQADGGAD